MIPTTRTIVAVRQVSARKACLVSCTSDELQALRPLRLMFSIRNPPNAAMGSTTSLSSMMPAIAANSSDLATVWQYKPMTAQNNRMAASWGANMDMSGMA
ncbi:hypothetical protein BKA83DRAFT_2210177 [Pisolithus microcarpus]|nr:hypothetical protein BKA83DRAFT_2210177 [Pisolithus microcarpus]